jgi:hypothetical protein
MMRLEYALKAKGYVRKRGNALEIEWDRFVSEKLGRQFFNYIQSAGMAPTLIERPPSSQELSPIGELKFGDANSVNCAQELFGAIRRLRNNLFHGGKSGDADHDRNDALIDEAISVVFAALAQCDDLSSEFEGKY